MSKYISWTHVPAGDPKGFILATLLFLTYINDLSNYLSSNVKLFVNDTSLFSVIHDLNTSVDELKWRLDFSMENQFQSWFQLTKPGSYFSSKIRETITSAFDFQQQRLSNLFPKTLRCYLDFKLTFEDHLILIHQLKLTKDNQGSLTRTTQLLYTELSMDPIWNMLMSCTIKHLISRLQGN